MPDLSDAACAGVDTELFYARESPGPKSVQEHYELAPAKRVIALYCNRCPVVAECLEWAVEYERYGIWGATTENERVKMRRSREVA